MELSIRRIKIILVTVLNGVVLYGQNALDTIPGEVSYKTAQSVYVRFHSTEEIIIGDTLFAVNKGIFIPLLIVKYISTISCVGNPLTGDPIEIGMRILARGKPHREDSLLKSPIPKNAETENNTVEYVAKEENDQGKDVQLKQARERGKIKGRISAAAYTSFLDHHAYNKQRMRYTLTLNTPKIANTKISAETYISFRHTINEWQEVKDNFKKTFKIYSLAFQYEPNEGMRIWFGRKINFNISNIGAIDGIQAEKKWNKTLLGIFTGSRPDFADYGFNFNLLQYGMYIGNTIEEKNGMIQNTFAIAEQTNHGITDRRFAYFQHLNSAIKHINIFSSFEFELYKRENDKPKSTLNISSVYVSLRYRASDKLSLFGSFDARKNIIYYETYKNFIDQLLEDETRQGFRFSFNYRPFKKITLGSNAGYRFQKSNPNPSTNMNTYLSYSGIPGLKASVKASAILIHSPYLDGIIYGIRISKDLFSGKLFGEIELRTVKYKYTSYEFPLKQKIVGTNLSWRLTKKQSVSINYEGDIQNKKLNSTLYSNIIQRF